MATFEIPIAVFAANTRGNFKHSGDERLKLAGRVSTRSHRKADPCCLCACQPKPALGTVHAPKLSARSHDLRGTASGSYCVFSAIDSHPFRLIQKIGNDLDVYDLGSELDYRAAANELD